MGSLDFCVGELRKYDMEYLVQQVYGPVPKTGDVNIALCCRVGTTSGSTPGDRIRLCPSRRNQQISDWW